MTSITASFVLAWALYASDYIAVSAGRNVRPRRSSGGRSWGSRWPPGWIEVLGLLVADQAPRRRGRHDQRPARRIGISGHPGHDRHRDRHGRRQRDERLHRVAVAAGRRRAGHAGRSAAVVAVLGFLFTLYLNSGDFTTKFENYLLFVTVLDGGLGRRGRGRLVEARPAGRRQPARRNSRAAERLSGPGGAAGRVRRVDPVPEFGIRVRAGRTVRLIDWSDELHGADIAFVVGFAVAVGRSTGSSAAERSVGVRVADRRRVDRGTAMSPGRRPGLIRRQGSRPRLAGGRPGGDPGSRCSPRSPRRSRSTARRSPGHGGSAFQRDRPGRAAGDERVVGQHEQAALRDHRLELQRPARDDLGRGSRSRPEPVSPGR